MTPGFLGRRPPSDWRHVEKFPLTASTVPDAPTPVVLGINWYSNFDSPVRDSAGHYWIGRSANLGSIRGGHCVCLKPAGVADNTSWWDFYNQGAEGACVGFGCSRAQTLDNRKQYLARWLWDKAKAQDEWSETNPGDDEGTSVRAGMEVLRTQGHVPYKAAYAPLQTDWRKRDALVGIPAEGIAAYRWATSAEDAAAVLGYGGLGYVDVLNSWGREYPHLTRMPLSVLQRLLSEEGEVAIVTDR